MEAVLGLPEPFGALIYLRDVIQLVVITIAAAAHALARE